MGSAMFAAEEPLLQELVDDTASHLSLPPAGVSALMRELLSLMTNERTGGAEGFVDLFRRAGIGDVMTSWFGGKQGRTISPSHVDSALGASTLDRIAASSGLTRAAVTSALILLLPKVISRLTPKGVLPTNGALRSMVSGYVERPGKEGRGWPVWLPWVAVVALILASLLLAR
jgi:uncharacterized protein YidB (DUF937 family)